MVKYIILKLQKHNLLLWLIVSIVITVPYFLYNHSQIAVQLQNNNFSLLADLAIATVALILAILLGIVKFAVGHFAAWLYGKMFEVAPRAMLQIQWGQAKILRLLSKVYVCIFRVFRFIQIAPRLRSKPETRHCSSSPAKLNSQSTIPYQLFPISCTLLN